MLTQRNIENRQVSVFEIECLYFRFYDPNDFYDNQNSIIAFYVGCKKQHLFVKVVGCGKWTHAISHHTAVDCCHHVIKGTSKAHFELGQSFVNDL